MFDTTNYTQQYNNSCIKRLDPRIKIISVAIIVILIASARHKEILLVTALALFLLLTALFSRVRLKLLLSRLLKFSIPILLISLLMPFITPGIQFEKIQFLPFSNEGLHIGLNILVRGIVVLFAFVILNLTTDFTYLLKGLEKLKVPKIFINLLSIMSRYISILITEADRMNTSRISRTFSNRLRFKIISIVSISRSILTRTYERGDRVFMAMLSRGLSDKLITINTLELRTVDWIVLVSVLSFLLLLKILSIFYV